MFDPTVPDPGPIRRIIIRFDSSKHNKIYYGILAAVVLIALGYWDMQQGSI